jgi:holo-[acyl-carrier-protein] synthase
MPQTLGIGIDAVDLKRVSEARYFERLSEYVLHEDEREVMRTSRDPIQFLASRLAMKEAVIKAFPASLHLQNVHVSGYGGKPTVRVDSPLATMYRIEVGLTHTPGLAIGVALVVEP